MMEALRATRDPDSCLRGLNQFRKGLRGEEGPAFLARYLRQSPEWQEMQAVWDTQLTVRLKHAAAATAATPPLLPPAAPTCLVPASLTPQPAALAARRCNTTM